MIHIPDNVQTIKIDQLKPFEKNPREHSDNQIKNIVKSITKFGFVNPILVNKKDNTIIAGHGRLLAAKQLNMTEVPVLMLDHLSQKQINELIVADNALTLQGGWDLSLLSEVLSGLDDLEYLELPTLDEETEETEVVEDEVPEKVETICKKGDIWQLGEHRLMCGDSTNADDVAKLMNGEKADIAFTSPPYNAGQTPSELTMKKKSKYQNDEDNKSSDEYCNFLTSFTTNSLVAAQYSFVNIQSLTNNKISLIDYLFKMKDFYADTIIWDKIHGQPAMAENVLNSVFEYVHVFSTKANRAIGTKSFRGTIDNIVHISKQNNNEYSKIHNATFPIDFAAFFIKNFANNSVVDLFGGVGTTLIACEQLNRKCFMMELDPHYCDVIIARWEKLTNKKATLC